MTEEKVVSSQPLYSGHVVRLKLDTVETPDGQRKVREVVEHDEVVAIVAIDSAGEALLVRQFRLPAGKELLEIPAGGIEPSEEPAEAVRREMQEETGYLPEKITRLGGFYSAPGFCTEYLHLFLAEELVPQRLQAEDTDEITLERVPLSRIPGLITSGAIEDAKSIAGLLAYLEYRKGKGG